jgi:TPR repeat protein
LGGIKKDYKIAAELFHSAARAGNTLAQYILGQMHETGLGDAVEQDQKEALELYLKAAEKGHKGAQFRAGRMFYYGYGTEKNLKVAAYYYGLAEAQGDVYAAGNLGIMLFEGQGIDKDSERGAVMLRKAADAGIKEVRDYMYRNNIK